MPGDKASLLIWNQETLDKERLVIKAELESVAQNDGRRASLRRCLERLASLSDSDEELDRLRQYIYAISALVHHSRHGGLNPTQIRRLGKLAHALLRTQGIQPGTSKRSFFYGTLQLALSDVFQREGRLWEAAWTQQLGLHLSHRAPSGGEGTQRLALGVRALRLGHAAVAERELEAAEGCGLSPRQAGRVRLERLKALRLSGRLEEAESLDEATRRSGMLSPAESRELEWERICRRAMRGSDISELVSSVRKGKSHHDYAYILEAFLWTRSVESRDWIERFPTARSIARSGKLDPRSGGTLLSFVSKLEQAYDSSLSFTLRLEDMGEALSRVSRLATVDFELLAWATAARWLARNRSLALAALALAEYEAMSLRLSRGARRDALGIMADLAARPWYEPKPAAPLRDAG